MARYTINLSELCEEVTGLYFNDLEGMAFDRIDTIAASAIPKLFSTRIDVLDNADDMTDLYRRILEHYWEYECCTYMPSDFILRLNRKLNEIMPYYNQRYESTKLLFPVFEDVDYHSHGEDSHHNESVDDNHSLITHGGRDITNQTNSGVDNTNSQESGTTGTDFTSSNHTETTDKTITDTDESTTNADINAQTVNWQYNNDTPQNEIATHRDGEDDSGQAGEPHGEFDYLTSYAKATSHKAKREVIHNVSGGLDADKNEYGRDVKYTDANGGSIGSDQIHKLERKSSESDSETTEDTTVSHGKGVNTDLTHGHIIDGYTQYGHTIDDKTDNVNNFDHEGKDHRHTKGKANSGRSYSEMLNLYRSTMINIYQEIIDELKELFFIIY